MTVAPWPSVDGSSCRNCGAHVSDRFRRVYGDNGDQVHRCGECDTFARLTRGSAAGVDVPIPDPETSPGRQGGEADV